jgi:hypothetical protein
VNCFAASAKLRKRHLPLFHHFSSGREQILVDFLIFQFLGFLADCVEAPAAAANKGKVFLFRRRKLFFDFDEKKKSKKNRK